MEGLDKLNLGHARLLYIIAEMYRMGRLDELEKYRLKEAVFLNDEVLFGFYEENCSNTNQDVSQLMEFLENLVRNRYHTRPAQIEQEFKQSYQAENVEEGETYDTTHSRPNLPMNEAAAKQLAFAQQHNLAVTTEKSDEIVEPMGSPVEANLMRKKL